MFSTKRGTRCTVTAHNDKPTRPFDKYDKLQWQVVIVIWHPVVMSAAPLLRLSRPTHSVHFFRSDLSFQLLIGDKQAWIGQRFMIYAELLSDDAINSLRWLQLSNHTTQHSLRLYLLKVYSTQVRWYERSVCYFYIIYSITKLNDYELINRRRRKPCRKYNVYGYLGKPFLFT